MCNKRWWLTLVAAWGWIILAPASGLGSGFALYEAGARSSALAGAVVARADDLSAIFYNPAGLVQLPGFQVMGGFSFIVPRDEIVTHFGGVDTRTLMDSQVSTIPHFFASYQAADRIWLGLGLNSPFGLGVKYNDNWPGSANLLQAQLQTLNINPTLAVKITDYLAAGAGLDLMYLNIKLQRVLPLPLLGPQTLHLDGDTWGVGFNLGLHLKPCDWLSMGVSYRSQVKQQVDGPAKFQPLNTLNGGVGGSIILPDTIFSGIMVRPLKNLSVEAGAYWTHWSLFRNFDLKFDNTLGTLSERKNWHDTWRGQLGVEYRALPWLDLRAGYAYEHDPMPDRYVDYLVPSTDRRHNFACGAGFRWRALTMDLAYTLVVMPDRTVNTSLATGVLPSDFQGRLSHVIVCSLGYKF
ncbi:MAG: OmpP1/FadL family transporter [Deltaproteobacteria bacterium]|nr:OmpP1/FadL family transporter [Deltaproteobacteria bacterium]